ncbi:DUF2860 domain-containing protein [Photobacterium aquimaris]|uniref:DUF2860 domain-containing protein n=1 Tax=Photobacterium aquimaris TaxID=512643 RepID=A0A2T3HY54_9GAMM|nr:DUF2860 domain-containing protein [Photobacterium aquimaris]OBU20273.1 hypothetical protein AYY21_03685 [Photobacterium aquimaris]PQJ41268.1 hypothetical protein BTN98_06405 [Photobacterium aquimaris]PSU04690.1 DUF2860 domain-containing protein [Photobacterium aquimaris]
MKPLLTVSLIATTIISTTAMAKPVDWTPGIGGEISLMVGYNKSNSQFNSDNHTTENLNNNGNDQTKMFVAPIGSLNYTFSSGDKQLYFGTSRSDIALGRFHIEAGYRQKFADTSTLTLSYIPGLLSQKTWQDPYLQGVKRNKTNSNINAFSVKLDNIRGSRFSGQIAYGKFSIDHENSGNDPLLHLTSNEKASLNRNANVLYTEGTFVQPFSRSLILRTAVNFTNIDADGHAMSNNIYGAAATIIQLLPHSSLAFTLSYKTALFDATHPVFNKKQQDNKFGAFLAYEYNQPFNWKNWGLVSLIGYSSTQSNINFYDSNDMLVSVGLNYKF